MGQLSKDEVFALAVQQYSDTVFRAAMHNCSCTADAEDVVQDVFEKLLNYSGRFESEEHLKAWLLRAAGWITPAEPATTTDAKFTIWTSRM